MSERERPQTRFQRLRQTLTPSDRTLSRFTIAFGLGPIRTNEEIEQDALKEFVGDSTEFANDVVAGVEAGVAQEQKKDEQYRGRREGVIYLPGRTLNRIFRKNNDDDPPPPRPAA